MTLTPVSTRRRLGRSLAAAAALVAAVAFAPMAGAAPAPIEIPLQTGALTVNGFTMDWPSATETGAKLVGTWDAETGALDATLESAPVTLNFPQLTGGNGTVTVVSAEFVGTVLPGLEGEVTGTVTVVVDTPALLTTSDVSVARPAGSVCESSGDLTFTSTLVPVAGGFGLTLTATGFDFPLDSFYSNVPGASDVCDVFVTQSATGTPTSETSLVITGTVTPPAPEPPAPAPTPATPKFTG